MIIISQSSQQLFRKVFVYYEFLVPFKYLGKFVLSSEYRMYGTLEQNASIVKLAVHGQQQKEVTKNCRTASFRLALSTQHCNSIPLLAQCSVSSKAQYKLTVALFWLEANQQQKSNIFYAPAISSIWPKCHLALLRSDGKMYGRMNATFTKKGRHYLSFQLSNEPSLFFCH